MISKTLLLVFIHGFKGNDDTFADFPYYLADLLQPTVPPNVQVKPLVYPQYETSGDLAVCVNSFRDWLFPFLEEEDGKPGSFFEDGTPKRQIATILIGHSMGGILIAETIIGLPQEQAKRVLGVLTFDTPFLGLNPKMVSNTTEKKLEDARRVYSAVSALRSFGQSTTTSTVVASAPGSGSSAAASAANTAAGGSSWMKWAAGAGGVAAVAAAAAVAYNKREEIQSSYNWIDSHLRFVKVLFQPQDLTARLSKMQVITPSFANFYTVVGEGNTFVKLPIVGEGWHAASNPKMKDEIEAHMNMFTAKTNPNYWTMAQNSRDQVSRWISDWVKQEPEHVHPTYQQEEHTTKQTTTTFSDVQSQDEGTIHSVETKTTTTSTNQNDLIDLTENPWA